MSDYNFTAHEIEMRHRIAHIDRMATLRASLGPVPEATSILPFMRRKVRPLANVVEFSKQLPAA